jgi:hypothetical protein
MNKIQKNQNNQNYPKEKYEEEDLYYSQYQEEDESP